MKWSTRSSPASLPRARPRCLAFDRPGALCPEVAPMMPSIAWALVRDDPTLKGTEADRYVRREYGGPNVAWLLSANASPETPAEPTHDDDVSEGLLRRVSQAIASFW